ncbi:MAG: hypothetical protein ACFFCE_05710 [Promethearchaeota archaeon]
MAYTETSEYEYITGDQLEDYACKTYANLIPSYSEAQVVAKISMAERIINSIEGKSFSGTIPDRIITATTLLAERMMILQMIKDGHTIEIKKSVEEFMDYIIKTILKKNSNFTIQSFEMYPDYT